MCLPVKPFRIEREWTHAGLSCAVTQPREAGNRCGYVRVPPGHPAFGKDYNDVDVSVHGGLTFSAIEPCTEHADGQGYWLGFDCGHWNDAHFDPNADISKLSEETMRSILIHKRFRIPGYGEHYWTEAEVAQECEQLADQLAAMEAP